jgi:hypothetical protein
LILTLLLACSGSDPTKDGVDDTADTDTDTDADSDADSDTDTDSSSTVSGALRLLDSHDGSAVGDVDIVLDGDSWETDKGGVAQVELPPSASVVLTVDDADWMPADLWLATDATEGWTGEWYMGNSVIVGSYARAYGAGYDATLADIAVFVLTSDGKGDWVPVEGAEVDLDVAYDYVITNHGKGVRASNEVEADGMGMVWFGGVTPGSATVTVTPPKGYTCGLAPAASMLPTLTASAGRLASLRVVCTM